MKPVQKALTTMLWLLMVLMMVSVIGAQLWRRKATLPKLASVPDFRLIDQDNKPFTRDALHDKVWIADFVFTHCAGPCPMMTARMAQLQKSIGAPVQFVSFSVDPERDTPDVLKEYAGRFKGDESRWKFLTGSKNVIFYTARGMLITAEPATKDSPIIHSEKFVLVDGGGQIRGYYDLNDDQKMAALPQDAASLVNE